MKRVVVVLFSLVVLKTVSGGIIREPESRHLENHYISKNKVQDVQSTTIEKEHEISYDQTTDELIIQINKKCREESGFDEKILVTVLKTAEVPPRDEKYLKFLGCSYKKQKYINENGKLQFHNIKKFLSRLYTMEDLRVLDVCGEIKQTEDAGQNAFNALVCILPKLVPLNE